MLFIFIIAIYCYAWLSIQENVNKKAVDLLEQIQPVPPKKQVQESCHKTHQAAKSNAPITLTSDPHTLTKEHEKEKEKENKKAGLQQKPVKKIHGQPRKEEPQPVTLGPHTLTKENTKTGLQQKPVKKIDVRPLKEAPQPVIGFKGLDESTRKRTPNCCHNLVLKPKNKLFTCNGCKEEGIEPRYRCEDCDYDFHKVCKSPKETTTHEFFKGSTFKFLSKPDKNIRICDACGRKIYGCSYHCKAKDLDMHPCCSNLKGKLCIGGTDFILKGKVKYKCLWCKKKKRDWIAENEAPGWSYVSKEKRLCCHVHCMWQMVFEAWKKDGFHGTDDDDDTSTMALSKIDLKDLVNSNGNGGRCRVKILKSVGIVLRAIIGILLGDPTVVLTPLLVESISK